MPVILAYQDQTFHLPPLPKFKVSMTSVLRACTLKSGPGAEISPRMAKTALLCIGAFAKALSWMTHPAAPLSYGAIKMVVGVAYSDIRSFVPGVLGIMVVSQLNEFGGMEALSRHFSDFATRANKDLRTLHRLKGTDRVYVGRIPKLEPKKVPKRLNRFIPFFDRAIRDLIGYILGLFNWLFGEWISTD